MRETTSTPQGLLLLLHASIFLWKIWYVSSKTLRKLWGWQHLDPNACSSYFLSALSSFSSFSSSSSLFPPITRLHCSSSMTTSPPAPAVIPKRWQKRGNNYKKNDNEKDKNKNNDNGNGYYYRQWQLKCFHLGWWEEKENYNKVTTLRVSPQSMVLDLPKVMHCIVGLIRTCNQYGSYNNKPKNCSK